MTGGRYRIVLRGRLGERFESAFDEVEYAPRIPAGEQDGEPCEEHDDDHRDVQEDQHDVVGNGEKPLHQRKPAIQITLNDWVVDVEVHRLMVVG